LGSAIPGETTIGWGNIIHDNGLSGIDIRSTSMENDARFLRIINNTIWVAILLLAILLAAFFFFTMIAAFINHYVGIHGMGELCVFVLVLLMILMLVKTKSRITKNIETQIENSIVESNSNRQKPLLTSHQSQKKQDIDSNERKEG
jgi:inner membrane protein involved in colicin E2 resistance